VSAVAATLKATPLGVSVCGLTGGTAANAACWSFTWEFATWCPPLLSLTTGCLLRGAVAKTHGIASNIGLDFLCTFCCPCCALVQEHHEVHIRAPAAPVAQPMKQQPGQQNQMMQQAQYPGQQNMQPQFGQYPGQQQQMMQPQFR